MINICQLKVSQEEKDAVMEVLDSGQLAQGQKVKELEENLAEFCKTKYALAVSSGTAALHLAVLSLQLNPGDEVITTPFTFIATANVVLMAGARPVFADINSQTLNLDPESVEKKITPRTKAIIVVNLYGQPADYSDFYALAEKYNLKIIEDAAQSIGAEYQGKMSGNLGDIGCFSFYATKNIMCGEGGAITTNDPQIYELVYQLRHHGQTGKKPYDYARLGYNYRLTDLQAVLVLIQLTRLKEITLRRQQIAQEYYQGLESVAGLVLPYCASDRTHVYHQFTILVTKDFPLSRDEFKNYLAEKGIASAIYYPLPLCKVAHFNCEDTDLPNTCLAAEQVLSLPIFPNLADQDVQTVIKAIKEL